MKSHLAQPSVKTPEIEGKFLVFATAAILSWLLSTLPRATASWTAHFPTFQTNWHFNMDNLRPISFEKQWDQVQRKDTLDSLGFVTFRAYAKRSANQRSEAFLKSLASARCVSPDIFTDPYA